MPSPPPFEPCGMTFSWRDVAYSVEDRGTKSRKQIVHPCSGVVWGGELMALMGPSGSGKTSLLDVLARRNRAHTGVQGCVRICGHETGLSEFRRLTAYVEQEDALLGALTVQETVYYAASLAVPCAPAAARRAATDRTLAALGLSGVQDVVIGTPLKKGISGGQKRRVSVATQLVTSPRVLFLDEPTSGLDSAAAFEVVAALRRVARTTGAAVVASIHQPSSATFALFDACLLLARGRMVYQGPVNDMVEFFAAAGVPCPPHTNPSEHALAVTNTDFAQDGDAADAALQQLVGAWRGSAFESRMCDRVTTAEAGAVTALASVLEQGRTKPGAVGKPAGAVAVGDAKGERLPGVDVEPTPGDDALQTEEAESLSAARCAWMELMRTGYMTHRAVVKAVRDPLAYGARLAMYLALAALMALAFFTTPAGQAGIQTVLNSLFFSAAFLSFMCVAYVPPFIEDLAVYRRERDNGLGSPLSFLLVNGLVGLPFLFVIALIYTLVVYWAVPYRSGGLGLFLLYLFLDLIAAESMVIAVTVLIPVFVVALAVSAFLNGLWMVVGGFLVPPNILNAFWTHSFWYINYQRYVFFGLVRNEVAAQDYACDPLPEGGCSCMYVTSLQPQCLISGAELTIDQMGFTGSPGLYIGVLIAIIFGMRAIAWLILRLRT